MIELPPFRRSSRRRAGVEPASGSDGALRRIVQAVQRTQLWLVTHSKRLAKAIEDTGEGTVRTVVKRSGATTIEGLTLLGAFRDEDD